MSKEEAKAEWRIPDEELLRKIYGWIRAGFDSQQFTVDVLHARHLIGTAVSILRSKITHDLWRDREEGKSAIAMLLDADAIIREHSGALFQDEREEQELAEPDEPEVKVEVKHEGTD